MKFGNLKKFLFYWIGLFDRSVFFSMGNPLPMELVDSLSVERATIDEIPATMQPLLVAFRHLNQTERVRVARRALLEFRS